MNFKTSFNSTPFHMNTINETAKRLKQAGYHAIELNASITPFGEPHIKPNMKEVQIVELVNTIGNVGLEVSSISAHFDLIQNDKSKRDEVINYTKQSIDIAKLLDNTIVHGYSGNKPDNMDDHEAWKILIDSVNEIVEYANSKDIRYAFEPAAKRFVNNGDTIKQLKNSISTGKLYINLDPANLLVAEDSIKDFINDFGNEITHVHIKDGMKKNGNIVFPPLGEGAVDFKETISLLKDNNYSGYLSVEYEAERFGYEDNLDDVLQSSLHFIKSNL